MHGAQSALAEKRFAGQVFHVVRGRFADRHGGKLDLSSFTDEAARRPAVQALLHKVNVTQDPETAGRPHRSLGGAHWWDVTVTLKNGERLVCPRVEANGGRGDSYGWKDKEAVFDKFRMLAGHVFKPSQVDAALNAIMSMEGAADVRSIVDTVIPSR